jgi:hypothetical protein
MFKYWEKKNLKQILQQRAVAKFSSCASKITGCPFVDLLFCPFPLLKRLQISLAFDSPLWSQICSFH